MPSSTGCEFGASWSWNAFNEKEFAGSLYVGGPNLGSGVDTAVTAVAAGLPYEHAAGQLEQLVRRSHSGLHLLSVPGTRTRYSVPGTRHLVCINVALLLLCS